MKNKIIKKETLINRGYILFNKDVFKEVENYLKNESDDEESSNYGINGNP